MTRQIGFLNQPIHIPNAHGRSLRLALNSPGGNVTRLKVVSGTAGAVVMRGWNIDLQTFRLLCSDGLHPTHFL